MQNQDKLFQQVWSVRVHLMSQFLKKTDGSMPQLQSYHAYPVCHDHTFTIVRENHHSFYVRLGPLEFFRSRGNFAFPLTALRFKFRVEIPDPCFVNSNHLLRKFLPFFTKSVQQLLCNFKTSTLLYLTVVNRNPPGGNSTFVQAFSQNAVDRCLRNSSIMCNFFVKLSSIYVLLNAYTFLICFCSPS